MPLDASAGPNVALGEASSPALPRYVVGRGEALHSPAMSSDEEEVLAAVHRRAGALVRGDAAELRHIMHERLHWTTRLGVLLDRESYIAGNTDGSLIWREQRLEEPAVTVVGDRNSHRDRC
jgi:Domain of unknown function (DUF4440)